jgi:hypothetical protein
LIPVTRRFSSEAESQTRFSRRREAREEKIGLRVLRAFACEFFLIARGKVVKLPV